jgi:hypothetical protein
MTLKGNESPKFLGSHHSCLVTNTTNCSHKCEAHRLAPTSDNIIILFSQSRGVVNSHILDALM